MMYGGNGVNAFVLLFGVLVFIGIVLVTFLAVRAGGRRGAGAPEGQRGRSQAREILHERYARGELTLEEYRERLQALGEYG